MGRLRVCLVVDLFDLIVCFIWFVCVFVRLLVCSFLSFVCMVVCLFVCLVRVFC